MVTGKASGLSTLAPNGSLAEEFARFPARVVHPALVARGLRSGLEVVLNWRRRER